MVYFLQSFEFNLGFGMKTSSPIEAGELLMKREYPQIFKSATTPHDVIFIPEVYLYGNITERVKYYIHVWSDLTESPPTYTADL